MDDRDRAGEAAFLARPARRQRAPQAAADRRGLSMEGEAALARAGHDGPGPAAHARRAAGPPTGAAAGDFRTRAEGHAGCRTGGDFPICAAVGGVVAAECLLLFAWLAL